jgi:hypothetical protein
MGAEQRAAASPDRRHVRGLSAWSSFADLVNSANAARQGPAHRETKTLEAEEESYFNDSSDEDPAGSSSSNGSSKKRQQTDLAADDQQPARKRARVDGAASSPMSSSAPATANITSPPISKSASGMVRSPALVFQEMAIKGAQGVRKRAFQPSKAPSLVDYGEDEDEPVSPKPADAAVTPSASAFAASAVDKPLPATPEKPRLLSPPPHEAVSTSLGSPFHAISGPASPTVEAEKPMLSLRLLGEKRRREEDDEDMLLAKAKNVKKGGANGAKVSANGIGSKFKINLKGSLGLGGDKK